MSSVVEIQITRGSASSTRWGWIAPAFTNNAGEQPARAYLEGVTRDTLQTGDVLTTDGYTYIVTMVGWWPPDSIEATLVSADLPDTCTIERASGGALNSTNHQMETTWSPVWSGACLVTPRSDTQATMVAGELTSVLQVEVLLPLAAPVPLVGHRITVTGAQSHPGMAGEVVFVTSTNPLSILRRVSAERSQVSDR